MLEELLRLRLPAAYNLKMSKVNVPLTLQSESFVLSDKKACEACKASDGERISSSSWWHVFLN
jgi:hypothetical protein